MGGVTQCREVLATPHQLSPDSRDRPVIGYERADRGMSGRPRRALSAADPHVCPTGFPSGVDVHETTFRVNVRWVTPLGEETASMS